MSAHVAEGIRRAGHCVFLDSDLENGIVPGAAWQRTLLRELRICDAVVFLNSRVGQTSKWCHTELAVATELDKRIYSLDLEPGLSPHPLLQSLQSIWFDSTIDTSIQRLTGRLDLDGLSGSTRPRWERGRAPYPGLAAMKKADAGVFFGREDEVRELVARVDGPLGRRDGELVVVIGPSGSGKSSLVQAGLAARLVAPQSGWAVAGPFEPGSRPLDRLLSRLVDLVPGQLTEGECRDRLLSEGMAAFGEWLVNHTGVPAERLLITLNQAEQLATVPAPREREEFLGVLGGGMGLGSPVTVVMTVRSDRFDEIQRLPVVGSAIHAPFVIAPISREHLPMVIEGPARRADLTFEPGLVSRLIDDTMRGSEEADTLPFLAFVLRAMYDLAVKQNRIVFTNDDYERVGRIDGAIALRAEVAEKSLPPDDALALDHLLKRFVTLSGERRPSARPVLLEQLTTTEQSIAQRLEDQRLLVGTGDAIRLAHDQLITAWPRLARVVADHRDHLLQQARLERQAADWKQGHGELLGRDATTVASSWLARQAEPGTGQSAVGEYIRACVRASHRRRAQMVSVLSVIVALALVACGLAAWAEIQRSLAVRQRDQAIAAALVRESQTVGANHPGLARLLALAAWRFGASGSSRFGMLEAAALPGIRVLFSSASPVSTVAFSPDGKMVAGASGEYTSVIQLWKTGTGHQIGATLHIDPGAIVASLTFTPDGKVLLVGGSNGTIRRWNIATGRLIGAPFTVGSGVRSMVFSPDGKILACGTDEGTIQLWNVAAGRPVGAPIRASGRFPSPVSALAFSPDSKVLASGILPGTVRLWNVVTGQSASSAFTLRRSGPVDSLAFSPDGEILAAGDHHGTIVLWDLAGRRQVGFQAAVPSSGSAPSGDASAISSVAFSPNGQIVASGSGEGTELWDAVTGQLIGPPLTTYHPSAISSVAFSPNGRTLISGADNGVEFWDPAIEWQIGAPLTESRPRPIYSVAFSPEGSALASGGSDGAIQFWNTATGRQIGPALTAHGSGSIDNVTFSPDDRILASGSEDGAVRLWSTATRRLISTLLKDPPAGPSAEGDSTFPAPSVAFGPNGRILATSGPGSMVRLWDAIGRPIRSIPTAGSVESIAFSPDSKILATGGYDGRVRLWKVTTGSQIDTPITNTRAPPIDSVSFSPNGKFLASGDSNGMIQLWNIATGKEFWSATASSTSAARSLAFRPDGNLLASGGYDGTVRLWDIATGQQIGASLTANPVSSIDSVAFSTNGSILASGNHDGMIRLWNVSSLTNVVANLCTVTRGYLTHFEWARYLPPGTAYRHLCP
jgi:WD40 repeat protein/energy-coupling factor transporter ATP-binding protein EcfA2